MPSVGLTVREFFISALVIQGVNEDEIRDECVLADLSRLGVFGGQLRVVVSETGRSFEALKKYRWKCSQAVSLARHLRRMVKLEL